MDGNLLKLITSNLTSPFNRKQRILFTARATRLLGLTFTGTSCSELEFVFFCLELTEWTGEFFTMYQNQENDPEQKLIIPRYITLSDIYLYLPLNPIKEKCWDNFIKALNEFELDKDSKWQEVKQLRECMVDNPINKD